MATRQQALFQLERLVHAYPERELSAETASLYLSALSDIPRRWLARAVRQWIETQRWFPKVAELRRLALDLAGVIEFDGEESGDALLNEYYRLCQRAWQEGAPDEAAWLALAEAFAQGDRPHMAARARERLNMFRSDSGDLASREAEA